MNAWNIGKKKGIMHSTIPFNVCVCVVKNYFLPSNCSFKAAKASMSPKVVEAA